MRVLVTGASGFVGRHLVDVLRRSGDEVTPWGLNPSVGRDEVTVDLLVPDEVRAQDFGDIDAVVHLAGLAQVAASFSDPALYVTTNATLEIHLMEALLEQGCLPRVLIISTGAVYGGGSTVLTEESPPSPLDPYAISKMTQEALGWYYATRGFEVIVARPFNHIGPGQERGYLVADLASQIAELEISGGGQITTGNLASMRDYTDVRDVAAAYRALLHAGRPGEIYNVCAGTSHSGEAIAAKLTAMARANITIARDPKHARPTDPSHVHASSDKMRNKTGWAPALTLDKTLADVLEDWRIRVGASPTPS